MSECHYCGDGVERTSEGWQHCEDLGIDVDGRIVVSTCGWGKPYPGPRFPHGVSVLKQGEQR